MNEDDNDDARLQIQVVVHVLCAHTAQQRKKPKGITISPALIGLRLLPARRRRGFFFFFQMMTTKGSSIILFFLQESDIYTNTKTHFINLVSSNTKLPK